MQPGGVVRLVVALLGTLLAGLCAASPTVAMDDTPDCPVGTVPSQPPNGGGWICIPATDPGTDPGPGGGGPGGGGGTPGTTACQDAGGAVIPCVNGDGGVWNAGRQCYAYPLVPQPPADSEYWEGHDPTEGNVWTCDRSVAVPGNTWFVPGRDAPPDPGQLARSVVRAMPLVKPTANMAPEPPLMTYVGLPTWLWMDEGQWGNVTGSATAGATTVTVVAEPVRVTWNLGDGVETCGSAGREWRRGMSSDEQTDCSYAFQHVSDFEPSGVFEVSAVISYAVNWTCAGNCLAAAGTLGEVAGATSDVVAIRVGERQSVVIR
jgi:hypothetical protein